MKRINAFVLGLVLFLSAPSAVADKFLAANETLTLRVSQINEGSFYPDLVLEDMSLTFHIFNVAASQLAGYFMNQDTVKARALLRYVSILCNQAMLAGQGSQSSLKLNGSIRYVQISPVPDYDLMLAETFMLAAIVLMESRGAKRGLNYVPLAEDLRHGYENPERIDKLVDILGGSCERTLRL